MTPYSWVSVIHVACVCLCSSHMSAMDRWNRLGAFYSMQISRVHRRFIMRHFSKLFSSGKTQLDHFICIETKYAWGNCEQTRECECIKKPSISLDLGKSSLICILLSFATRALHFLRCEEFVFCLTYDSRVVCFESTYSCVWWATLSTLSTQPFPPN